MLHATKEGTIKTYLTQLQLTYKQKAKLNKLRQLANMQAIEYQHEFLYCSKIVSLL